ncbi:uncharacterized protein LOC121793904 [Salvia splendens]|uniref:uncharacterized protein LOC121793904 n=1 Tax=Salvia splendens TaxID=180675 RepID=UPI001C278549|nr:uncharacterized protein LOC121793904 [Salvia splendens]
MRDIVDAMSLLSNIYTVGNPSQGELDAHELALDDRFDGPPGSLFRPGWVGRSLPFPIILVCSFPSASRSMKHMPASFVDSRSVGGSTSSGKSLRRTVGGGNTAGCVD